MRSALETNASGHTAAGARPVTASGCGCGTGSRSGSGSAQCAVRLRRRDSELAARGRDRLSRSWRGAEGGRRGRQLTPGRGVQRGCGRRQPEQGLVERLARGRRRAAPAAAAADGARAAARGPVADVHDVGLLLVHVSDGRVASARHAAAWSPSRNSRAGRHSMERQPASLRPAEPCGWLGRALLNKEIPGDRLKRLRYFC